MQRKYPFIVLFLSLIVNLLILHSRFINLNKKPQAPTKLTREISHKKGEISRFIYVSIIIDDIGDNFNRAVEIWSINDNITLSIIPFLKEAKKISLFAKEHNLHAMLHMPMEPLHSEIYEKHKEHFLTCEMDKMRFLTVLNENLHAIPYYEGINNHMGSKLTADSIRMNWFFNTIQNSGVFFIDSKTTKHSIAAELSDKYGILTGIRDVFIDNEKDENYILAQLEKLSDISLRYGYAIGIGHPKAVTVKSLKRFLQNKNIKVVPVKFGLKNFQQVEKRRIFIHEDSSY